MWVFLSHFRLTFRRCAVSPVFISPSKGGISANVSHRLCKAVFPKRAAYPPSEGGPYPAVSVSPSEGEHVYLYHDGREMRESVPLWKRAGEAMPSRRSVERVQRKITYRNGSESRESVPLWKGTGKATPSRRSVERVRRKMMYRNGREMRESVPLWKEAGKATPSRRSIEGCSGK